MPLASRLPAEPRWTIPCACVLGAVALAACRGGPATTDTRTATGDCLGRVCLGMSEESAVSALGAGGAARAAEPADAGEAAAGAPGGAAEPAGARHCYRVRGGAFYSFWVDIEDPGRRVTGVLATSVPHCADPVEVDDAGSLVTCRGVRLGDAESFVAKIDRHAVEAKPPAYPWPEAPEGTRQIDDDCESGSEAARVTTLYLAEGKVAGLAIWEAN
jgi:hypothetical protein